MIIRRLVFLGLVLTFASTVSAQQLHAHPQCDHYVADTVSIDPGVTCHYPTFSAQEHWRVDTGRITPDNTCALAEADNLTCAHLHNDLTCPYDAELSAGATVTCGVSITLHHFPGRVTRWYPGFLHGPVPDIIWDATGSSTPPVMIGDPLGDVVFTGHFTVTLPPNVQGWWSITNKVYGTLDDGSDAISELLVPIWSTQRPTSGEIFTYHLPALRAVSNFNGTVHPETTWGQLTIEYDDLVPVAPIFAPWLTSVAFYSYGRPILKPGTNEIHYDMDLHHENRGRTVFSTVQSEDLGMPWTFDPTLFGSGSHKAAAFRVQPDGVEQLTTVLVQTITIGDGVPPPPPPPPPVSTWQPTTGNLERNGNAVRIMLLDGKVVNLPDAVVP